MAAVPYAVILGLTLWWFCSDLNEVHYIHIFCIWRTRSGYSIRVSVMSDSLWLPWTVARQASLSMEFSRQEYWTGLPFPSPMHESEKWKWSHSVVSDSSRPHGLQPSRLLHPWDFPGKSTGVGRQCLLQYGCESWTIKKIEHWRIDAFEL